MKKKIVAFILVFALALALGIGGTLAWLTAESKSVVNTFTIGDINIKLEETGATLNAAGTQYDKNYAYVPGDKLAKDPMVSVLKGSEACYLFVKVDANNNKIDDVDQILTWSPAEGWDALEGVAGVYYREVDAVAADAAKDAEFYILDGEGESDYKNGYVTVSTELTKEQVTELNANKPTLTFTAYAVQSDNVADAAAAWNIVKGS